MTALLLAVAVAAVWLGCVGFIRLTDAFDRLHCVAFVGIAAGVPVMLAGWVSQGADPSMVKVCFLIACILVNGAALGHATGRALHHRRQAEPE